MNEVLHKTQVFKHMCKYNGNKWESKIEVVCADVYKITVGSHSRLICAFRNKSRWIPMDVLTGIALQGNFTTKTTALQAIVEYFEKILDPEYPVMISHTLKQFNRREKELFKALDENQKVCYNRLVDLCEN
ncbi:MAG: hypothetical protein II449_00335 [Prevotella sp.]|nr:hypothetical protein [Prevotella sp.]